MALYEETEFTCAVCGKTHPFKVYRHTFTNRLPDLDCRPHETEHAALTSGVQECPDCGYASHRISDRTSIDMCFLRSEAYLTCEGHTFRSDTARMFWRAGMISLQEGRMKDAAYAMLCCVWASDDAADTENAKICRLKTADLLEQVPEDDEKEVRMTVRMDMLRRAGQFERLLREYADVHFTDHVCRRIARVEKKLSQEGDAGKHTMNLVFNNRICEYSIAEDAEVSHS